jgi:hypothetical protein
MRKRFTMIRKFHPWAQVDANVLNHAYRTQGNVPSALRAGISKPETISFTA